MPKAKHPNMVLRRLLLDGVKIIEPYRRMIRVDLDPKDEVLQKELKLLTLWVNMARVTALKLKKNAGSAGEKP